MALSMDANGTFDTSKFMDRVGEDSLKGSLVWLEGFLIQDTATEGTTLSRNRDHCLRRLKMLDQELGKALDEDGTDYPRAFAALNSKVPESNADKAYDEKLGNTIKKLADAAQRGKTLSSVE